MFSSCPLWLLRLREDGGGWQTSASPRSQRPREPGHVSLSPVSALSQCTQAGYSCVTRPQSGVLGSLTSQEVPVPPAPPCPCQPRQGVFQNLEVEPRVGSPAGFLRSCLFSAALCAAQMLLLVFPSRGASRCGLELPWSHAPPASASQGAGLQAPPLSPAGCSEHLAEASRSRESLSRRAQCPGSPLKLSCSRLSLVPSRPLSGATKPTYSSSCLCAAGGVPKAQPQVPVEPLLVVSCEAAPLEGHPGLLSRAHLDRCWSVHLLEGTQRLCLGCAQGVALGRSLHFKGVRRLAGQGGGSGPCSAVSGKPRCWASAPCLWEALLAGPSSQPFVSAVRRCLAWPALAK